MAGISNTFVFMTGNNRAARNKLSNMGGIMSSSEELMQAAMPIVKEVMKSVEAQPKDYSLGGAVRAGLNFVPNVASNVVARGINPFLAAAEKIGNPLRMVNPKNIPTSRKPTFKADGTVDITKPAQAFKSDMIKKFSSLTTAKDALDGALEDLIETDNKDKSENKDKTKEKIETVTNKSIEKNYEDSIGPIPKGMTVGELTREFIRVAKNTAIADPGSFAERFGKSILLGLNTELATKYSKGTKRSGTSPREDRSDAIREFAEKLITQGLPADQAMAEAKRLIGPLYPTGGGTPSDTSTDDSNIKLTKDQQALVELAKKEIEAGRDPDIIRKILIEKGVPAGVV